MVALRKTIFFGSSFSYYLPRFLVFPILLFVFFMKAEALLAASPSFSPVSHVVLCWLKEEDRAERDNLIKESLLLKKIPGILQFKIGTAIPSTRGFVDSSFDIGVYILFRSKRDMDLYLTHPLHQRFVQQRLKPHLKKLLIYDFAN